MRFILGIGTTTPSILTRGNQLASFFRTRVEHGISIGAMRADCTTRRAENRAIMHDALHATNITRTVTRRNTENEGESPYTVTVPAKLHQGQCRRGEGIAATTREEARTFMDDIIGGKATITLAEARARAEEEEKRECPETAIWWLEVAKRLICQSGEEVNPHVEMLLEEETSNSVMTVAAAHTDAAQMEEETSDGVNPHAETSLEETSEDAMMVAAVHTNVALTANEAWQVESGKPEPMSETAEFKKISSEYRNERRPDSAKKRRVSKGKRMPPLFQGDARRCIGGRRAAKAQTRSMKPDEELWAQTKRKLVKSHRDWTTIRDHQAAVGAKHPKTSTVTSPDAEANFRTLIEGEVHVSNHRDGQAAPPEDDEPRGGQRAAPSG